MASPFWVRHRGFLTAAAVLALPLVVLLPVPAGLMDFLLSANLLLSVLILLSALSASSPLAFSSFPTVLLLATLGRLVLTLATTRLVLTRAPEEGFLAAGRVVWAFGNFVAGDSPLVGLALFGILAVIQFLVITKGAGRIAEVAARFTLDALPGRQMAIDADLGAGLITESQARERRGRLAREADFYGAMDGASRFVRGDAVASLLVIAVALIGGLAVGVLQHGMPPAEAWDVFARLSIGDGLLAQLPALLVSMAAALLVTRPSRESDLGEDLLSQVFREPRVLAVAAGFMGLLLLTPLPKPVSLILALSCGGLAWLARQGRRRESGRISRLASPPPSPEALLPLDPLGLELGYALVPLAEALPGRISALRRELALELGLVLPELRVRDNLSLDPHAYAVTLRGAPLATGLAYADRVLAVDPGGAGALEEGIPARDPVLGLPALWIPAGREARASALGWTTAQAAQVLATHLAALVRTHAAELLTRQEVHALVEGLRSRAPGLVDEVLGKGLLSQADLQKILQNLLREQVSIRDLEAILETLGDHARRTQDPDILTEYVRHGLSRALTQAAGAREAGRLRAAVLDPRMEPLLLDPALPPRTLARLAAAVARETGRLSPPVLLCAPAVRARLSRACREAGIRVSVLATSEVAGGIPVESAGLVALEDVPAEAAA